MYTAQHGAAQHIASTQSITVRVILTSISHCFTEERPEIREGKLSWPKFQGSFLTLLIISSFTQPDGSGQDLVPKPRKHYSYPVIGTGKLVRRVPPDALGPTDSAALETRSVDQQPQDQENPSWPRGPFTPGGRNRPECSSLLFPNGHGLLFLGTWQDPTPPLPTHPYIIGVAV